LCSILIPWKLITQRNYFRLECIFDSNLRRSSLLKSRQKEEQA
jgi:hypothetical protein